MNQYLKAIQDLLQQNNQLADQDKQALIKTITDADKQWNITEFKLDRTEKVKRTTGILLEETIEELEQKRKAVEEQNRELEIESALERVRTAAMSMKKPADMLEVCRIISDQLELLRIEDLRNVQTAIFDVAKHIYMNYEYYRLHNKTFTTEVDYTLHHVQSEFANQMLKGEGSFFTTTLTGEKLNEFVEHQKSSPEFVDPVLFDAKSLTWYWYSLGPIAFGVSVYSPMSEAGQEIVKRFRNVFDLSYRRYLDIELAIAQAREAKIEAALERVRAASMAMHHSDELHAVADVLFQQLRAFGGKVLNAGIALCKLDADEDEYWLSSDDGLRPVITIPHTEDWIQKKLYGDWKNKSEFYSVAQGGDELKAHYQYMSSVPSLKPFFKEGPDWSFPTWQKWHAAYFSHGYMFMITLEPYDEEKILVRFARVFEQAYTRFLDLQKAEAQAREAQIEAALEKVRSRSLAMHKSNELNDVVTVLFERLKELQLPAAAVGIHIYIDGSKDLNVYVCGDIGNGLAINNYLLPYFNHPIANDLYDVREKKLDFFVGNYSKEEKNSFYEYVFEHSALQHLPDDIKNMILQSQCYSITTAPVKNSMISVNDFEGKHLSESEADVLKRFAKVFEQAYTRFLDLKRAEAQARESQIQLALERVRSRTMAMQRSEELQDTTLVLFQQFKQLRETTNQVSICIFDDETKNGEMYLTLNGEKIDRSFTMELDKEVFVMKRAKESFLKKEETFTAVISGKELQDYNHWRNSLTGMKRWEESDAVLQQSWYVYGSFFSRGMIGVSADSASSEELQHLLDRFSQVFDGTYTRFNDLKKAEAQAREAQIEAALEKVRSRSLAMHKSDELTEVVKSVFDRLHELNIELTATSILIFEEGSRDVEWWLVNNIDQQLSRIKVKYANILYLRNLTEAKENNRELFSTSYSQAEKSEFFNYFFECTDFKNVPESVKKVMLESTTYNMSVAFGKNTGILISRLSDHLFSEKENDILKRFAKVFDQAYTRFQDLQKAETQARESQIQLALERARAQSMMMQHSTELDDTLRVFHEQVLQLNIPSAFSFLWLPDEANGKHIFWAAWGENSSTVFKSKAINYPLDRNEPATAQCLVDWKSSAPVVAYHVPPQSVKDYFAAWNELIAGVDELKPENFSDGLYYVEAFMKYGCFGVMVKNILPEDEKKILIRFAVEFERAYTRFLDLQKAEAQAKESQIQLALERVRARTMAMQRSDELSETVFILFQQFRQLGENPDQATIGVINEEEWIIEYWVTMYGTQTNRVYKFSIDEPNVTNRIYKAWKEKKKSLVIDLAGKELYDFATYREGMGGAAYNEAEKRRVINVAFFSRGLINVQSNESRSAESILLLERFAAVFEQTYTRFNDLKKAEEQAREAKIETSLERVRSRAMAMQNSEELNELVGTVFTELTKLELALTRSVIIIYEPDGFTGRWWMANSETPLQPMNFLVKYDDQPFFRAYWKGWQERILKWTFELEGDDKIKTDDFLFSKTELSQLPDFVIAGMRAPGKVYLNASFNNFGNLTLATLEPLSNEHFDILLRFAKVFDLTYTRFNDLKQAEAQARESMIETSLERVRSKTMAMHNSQDVGDTVATMFDEVVKLGIETIRCGIGIMHEPGEMEVWTAKPDENGKADLIIGRLDMMMHPLLQGAFNGWRHKDASYTYELKGDDLINYFTSINNHPDYPVKYDINSLPSKIIHTEFFFPEGTLFVFSLEKLETGTVKVFKRFSGVFGQTYRRYLDLQRAEAQARHAQVEAAMEKVRSRALAMQKPNELIDVAQLLRKEMSLLGVEELETSSIYIHNEETGKTECWYAIKDVAHPEKELVSDHMTIDLGETWVGRQMLEFYRSDKRQISIPMQGESRKEWINYCADHSKVLSGFYGNTIPDRTYHLYKFSNGYMGAASPGDISKESWDLLQRATSVFSFAYTRFSDLQQAEAQAREATIEAALERVRGKAMAMHNSNDLSSASSLVFTELRKLGINPIRCGVGLLNKESRKAQLYSAASSSGGDSLSLVGWVMLSGHPVMEKIYDTWARNDEYYPELTGEQLKSYYELLLSGLSVAVPDWQSGQKQFGHFLPFSVGCLYAWSDTPYNEDQLKIIKRFAAIIDLTFRRYIDLQKSEANAREAVKQAALDRVRADIASMRTIDDLDRITPLIWNELTILGIPFIRCGVFIMDDSQQLIHTFLSTPDGKAIAAFHIPYDTPGNIEQVIRHWHDSKNYIDHWDEKAFTDFAGTLVKQGALASPEQYLKTIPHGGFHLHFLPFLQGMLYVGNTDRLGDDEIKLIQSVADAFSTAYARYEDFNKLEAAKEQVDSTLNELQATQKQLVQSEKMASLGELTAGIAHEIQNPLNFVNNFSDVSNELLDEMKVELKKGNTDEAMFLAEDVKQNLEKILHHGKRADAIVKGMLQHSRSSSGEKELTDINVLADEYVRLCYHGLRAKDKSFNATMKTDFDETLEKINIIPQDMGRVLLNLLTNAFYAVNERRLQSLSLKLQDSYEPTVSISTKKINGKIEIKVSDNGNGIPQNIVDKIFQPFFTTKPTGQGTGLGLSLSYDIVKAHGGEIKVETQGGQGSKFIIQMPV